MSELEGPFFGRDEDEDDDFGDSPPFDDDDDFDGRHTPLEDYGR